MNKVIFISLIFISSISYGQELRIIPVNNLKSCRKDFAVKLCKLEPNTYRCFKFNKQGKEYLLWNEIFDNERIRVMAQKINRRNSLVWKNHCIAVPFDLSKDEMEFAPFNKKLFPDFKLNFDGMKIIVIDLNKLSWGAYSGLNLIKWGAANGGVGKCKETGKNNCKTPIGCWKVLEKKKSFSRSTLYPVECKDKKVCGHPLFNAIKFHSSGTEIHGDKNVPGSNISHGCVRVFIKDSKWLHNFVEIGTTICVYKY